MISCVSESFYSTLTLIKIYKVSIVKNVEFTFNFLKWEQSSRFKGS